jgi:Zn ribbon nucleic-acid-binding protein
MMLAGAICPHCGEDDVNWLSVEDDSVMAHCDRCGTEFALPDQSGSHAGSSRLPVE